MDIGVGDWVECINVGPIGPGPTPATDLVRLGCLYLITHIVIIPPEYGPGESAAFILKDTPHHPNTFGFYPDRFRPIHRPGNSTLIRDLLTKLPAEKERA
jgi:hypothetical protein